MAWISADTLSPAAAAIDAPTTVRRYSLPNVQSYFIGREPISGGDRFSSVLTRGRSFPADVRTNQRGICGFSNTAEITVLFQ